MTRPRKRAEVGIAVEVATDVAKAAASLVLTNPGLTDIVAAVETSRRIYQRMLTYTLNKIIKTVEIRTLSEQRRNGCSRLHGARKKFWLNEGERRIHLKMRRSLETERRRNSIES